MTHLIFNHGNLSLDQFVDSEVLITFDNPKEYLYGILQPGSAVSPAYKIRPAEKVGQSLIPLVEKPDEAYSVDISRVTHIALGKDSIYTGIKDLNEIKAMADFFNTRKTEDSNQLSNQPHISLHYNVDLKKDYDRIREKKLMPQLVP